MISKTSVIEAFRSIVDPDTGKDLVRADRLRDLEIGAGKVSVTVMLSNPGSAFAGEVEELVRSAINARSEEPIDVVVRLDNELIGLGEQVRAGGQPYMANQELDVARTIAVASGKGGVGKSTVSVNLAVSLAKMGYDVGLLDADIYGPSIPTMFGVGDEKPRVNERRKIVPLERYGVRLLSMGFLADQDQAVIWRGPMVSNAVRQFLGDADWGALDYLILDLPPGTGDIQLTIVQTVALTGAIIVSTPQDVALADARRGVAMFRNVQVPVLGIVENMAYFTPPDLPDRRYYLFGEGGAQRLAAELEVPFLGEVPIEQALRESGDEGTPLTSMTEVGPSGRAIFDIARQADDALAIENAERSSESGITFEYK